MEQNRADGPVSLNLYAGADTRYVVRLSEPAVISATAADIEYTGRIKSLDSATRTGDLIVAASPVARTSSVGTSGARQRDRRRRVRIEGWHRAAKPSA